MDEKCGKPRIGVFLLASPRFKNLGDETPKGTYHFRKESEVEGMLQKLGTFADTVYPGIIYEREQVGKAIRQFGQEQVDCIIAQFLSWSEDFAWIRFLRDIGEVPVLLIHPVMGRAGFTNTHTEDDFIEFLSSGGLVGSLEGSGSIPRLGKLTAEVALGSWDEIFTRIERFGKAAKTRSSLKNARFGLLASYNELMWSTYIDPYNLFARIGPELKFISCVELSEEIGLVSDGEAEAYKGELESRYPVMEDVDPVKFLESARASLGLANLVDKRDIDALVLNDVDPVLFKLTGLRPGFYHESLNRRGSVMVPEADIGAAVITYILKKLSGKVVNFIEPFYMEEDGGCFAGGHAGPNDHTDPEHTGRVQIARDVRFAKTAYKHAGAPFAWYRIAPGIKTMAHFSENNGRYKLLCTLVESLEGEHFITSYSHSMFKPLTPVKELFGRILNTGTTQHFAVVDGDYRTELQILAKMLEFEFHSI